jgi:M61 glycyl aminopeptidase
MHLPPTKQSAILRFLVAQLGLGACLLVCSAELTTAQITNVMLRVSPQTATTSVEGACAPTRIWSFRKSYGAVMDLGNRIEKLTVRGTDGREIPIRKIAPGEFESASPASRFSYEVDLAPPKRPDDAAFVSWLISDRGLFLPGDLLPEFRNEGNASSVANSINRRVGLTESPIAISFALPEGWAVHSPERKDARGEFEVADLARAVFVAGTGLRANQRQVGAMAVSFVMAGDWAFADEDAVDLALKVIKAHAQTFGAMPGDRAVLILMPFPGPVAADEWTAETRGSTVTLLIGKEPARTAALARLSVPLTHELFHLWVPNGLALEGDYVWFYEGFTIYEAARAAVRLRLLTFQDFLNAIARAYDACHSSVDCDRLSLTDASNRRWTNGESNVYQKAMLVAFLYDLNLRLHTGSKRSLEDAYRKIFRRYHRFGDARDANLKNDGNQVAVEVLSEAEGMRGFGETLIQRPVTIDLGSALAPFGLNVERAGVRSRISVSEKINRGQRDLLRKLGYNDEAEIRRDHLRRF